jgi:hypothetical protein
MEIHAPQTPASVIVIPDPSEEPSYEPTPETPPEETEQPPEPEPESTPEALYFCSATLPRKGQRVFRETHSAERTSRGKRAAHAHTETETPGRLGKMMPSPMGHSDFLSSCPLAVQHSGQPVKRLSAEFYDRKEI